ncbi:hypothetical protein GTB64_004429 [Salmonella enterica]|nr:hypothetical protein [Salmonella enterica]
MKPYMYEVRFTQEDQPSNSWEITFKDKAKMDHLIALHRAGGFSVQVTELYTREQVKSGKKLCRST